MHFLKAAFSEKEGVIKVLSIERYLCGSVVLDIIFVSRKAVVFYSMYVHFRLLHVKRFAYREGQAQELSFCVRAFI